MRKKKKTLFVLSDEEIIPLLKNLWEIIGEIFFKFSEDGIVINLFYNFSVYKRTTLERSIKSAETQD